MSAIPTVYKGIQFRSRLEARWACFFDLIGWKYQYEPFDLEGWIPDFVISNSMHKDEIVHGCCHDKIYIEIKPVDFFPSSVARKINGSMFKSFDEQKKYNPDHFDPPILILGYTISVCSPGQIGWIKEGSKEKWRNAYIRNAGNGYVGSDCLFSGRGSFIGISDYPYAQIEDWEMDIIIHAWNKAGNMVQWRGPQSVTE